MLFRTAKAQLEWEFQASALLSYHKSVQELEFDASLALLEDLENEHVSRLESLTNSDPDDIFDDYFLFGALLGLLRAYAEFWDKLLKAQFGDSWSSMQDAEDALRTLRKFGNTSGVHLLESIEEQCSHLEKLYPYKWFCSTEIVYNGVECSICGKDMNGQECPHISGELYRGKLAAGRVKGIKLQAVALVQNPRDKRCVFDIPDDGPQFQLVRYLMSVMRDGRFTPFGFVGMEEKKIKVTIAERKILGRNKPCLCGSGKKFKKCCINDPQMEKDHVKLYGTKREIVTAQHLVNLAGT